MARAALAIVLVLVGTASALPLPEADAPPLLSAIVANPLAGDYLVHRNADVAAKLAAVAEENPELAKVESIGKSVLQQDLWAITLAGPNGTARYRVYLDGEHHGNEYMGTEIMMALLGHLVEGWKAKDPAVVAFLDEHVVKIVPIVNPDGNMLDTRKNARQVDLNRNYPYRWGEEPGSSGVPAEPDYRGESALSEPESVANWNAGVAFAPHIWITAHTGIAEFYWPWGWTADKAPDWEMFERLEKPFEEATNGRVDAKQGFELYPVTGATDDSAYALLGVPGFTYEIHEDQFFPAYPNGIGPELADQLAGLLWAIEHTRHMGANVGATSTMRDGALVVELANEGWGAARNLTVNLTLDGAVVASRVVDVPARGTASVSFADAPAGATVGGHYPRLLAETSPVWGLAEVASAAPAAGDILPTPGPAVVAALGALAVVALAARRRR